MFFSRRRKLCLFAGLGIVLFILLVFVFLISLKSIDHSEFKPRLYERLSRKWQDHSVFEGAVGYIYAVDSPWSGVPEETRARFKRYDLSAQQWMPLENAPRISPPLSCFNMAWDVNGPLLAACAIQDDEPQHDRKAFVWRLNDAKPIAEIGGQYCQVRLSPSNKKAALIEDCGGIFEFKSEDGQNVLGRKGKLKIFEIATGQMLTEYCGYVLAWGLSWAPDEKSIAFVSYADQGIFTCQEREIGFVPTQQAKDKCEDMFRQNESNVYIWNLSTNETLLVGEGISPDWNSDGRLIFSDGRAAYICLPGETPARRLTRFPYDTSFRWVGSSLVLACVRAYGRPPRIVLQVLFDGAHPAKRCAIGTSYLDGCFSPL